MAELIYFGCAALSLACATLLFREYHRGRKNLLLWSSGCFTLLAINNTFIFFDLVIFSEIDLHGSTLRNLFGALAGGTMLFGLIWEIT